jgi:small subunit ribosomal protein S4
MGLSYKTRSRDNLQALRVLKLFYGGLSRRLLKKLIKIKMKCQKKNISFLEFFERRLDIILYRSKFSSSIRSARQLIIHGKILVNHKPMKIKSYIVNLGDLISINSKDFKLVSAHVQQSEIWPIPPKYLTINYKTLQIIFGTLKHANLSLNFFYPLNIEKIINSCYLR